MTTPLRIIGLLLALTLAAVLGWRIVATTVADQQADTTPADALAWDPGNRDAQLAKARAQLRADHPVAAASIARAMLATAPLRGDGFAILASAARQRGDTEAGGRLDLLALRRAPRNQVVRARVIGMQLQAGNYADALHNLDVLLSISPRRAEVVLPLVAPMAADPAFAEALGVTLAKRPDWRWRMLDAIVERDDPAAVDAVYNALARHGGLDNSEFNRWLVRLGAAGRWGEAYSRWVGRLQLAPGTPLPLVWNGTFEQPPSGLLFDWRMRGQPGTVIERIRRHDGPGHSARVSFFNRRANDPGFDQTLLLAPGRYRLDFDARAQRLRSDQGVAWAITCVGHSQPLATSPRLKDSFDWRPFTFQVTVPAGACPAQRLALINPGADAAGKIVSGTLWFDDFQIQPVSDAL